MPVLVLLGMIAGESFAEEGRLVDHLGIYHHIREACIHMASLQRSHMYTSLANVVINTEVINKPTLLSKTFSSDHPQQHQHWHLVQIPDIDPAVHPLQPHRIRMQNTHLPIQ